MPSVKTAISMHAIDHVWYDIEEVYLTATCKKQMCYQQPVVRQDHHALVTAPAID